MNELLIDCPDKRVFAKVPLKKTEEKVGSLCKDDLNEGIKNRKRINQENLEEVLENKFEKLFI